MLLLALLNVALREPMDPANLIPKPVSAQYHSGEFVAARGALDVRYVGGADHEAAMFANELKRDHSDLTTRVSASGKASAGEVAFVLDPTAETGDEGYSLSVGEHHIEATSKTTAGLFYAGQTLRQLLGNTPGVLKAPTCDISDAPSYGWRGLLLDVSRHFRPKADIERYLDIMAAHKLNVFHWHLVDDGGWRIEIKKYPELTRRGAWRSMPKESWGGPIVFPAQHSGDEYGGFYTQKEIKEIVAYAAARHITILPEIEMPGHSLEAISCYPQLGCDKPDGSGTVLNSNYCPGKEETFTFLEGVLDEVCDLFPSKYIHIGGDEVDKTSWKVCPKCQARIKSEGLKNEEELQSYFIRRIEKYLNSKGRRLIGWDEILEGGLAPNATVMSWRGIDGGIQAANQGKNAVMCPTSHCYFDYPYSTTSLEKVYSYNPTPAALTEEQSHLILGGQGNLWTEWIPTRARLDAMTWPRAAALAEVFWTPSSEQNWDDFNRRMPAEYARLASMGVSYMPPSPSAPVSAILTDGPTKVEFDAPPMPGATLRYSTNGQDPTADSPLWTGAVQVDSDSDVRAAYFNPAGGHGDVARIQVHIGPVSAPSGELAAGWNVGFYEGRFAKLPDFSQLTPVATGTAQNVDLAVRKQQENYALRFTGYIDIPQSGVYTFYLTSDDGSSLHVGGAMVVDNDSDHPPVTKTGRIQLQRGRYPIEVQYFQIGGAQSLKLEISGPGLDRETISPNMVGH